MAGPLLSLIVPVYNTEAFLPKCLDSLLGQSFSDIEIIVVDDGSPGNCKEICAAYPQVKYVSCGENLGLFRAREFGARLAQGSYIFNIDSDDFLPLDACLHISRQIKISSCDIYMHGSSRILPKNILKRPPVKAEGGLFAYFTSEKSSTHIFIWQLAIKKEILLKIYSDLQLTERLILSEDILHFYTLIYYAKSWGIVPQNCYCYNENNTSATRKKMDTSAVLKDLQFMNIVFTRLENFRVLKGLPSDAYETVKQRQAGDRLREMAKEYKNIDMDKVLPVFTQVFGFSILGDSLFDITRSPSAKAWQGKFFQKFIRIFNKLLPEGSQFFNILQTLWWRAK